MHTISLSEALRWQIRKVDDRHYQTFLQVLVRGPRLDQEGQGTYEDKWVDVPVFAEEEKEDAE